MLSTPARYVAGLGAKLEVNAVFDDGESHTLLGPTGTPDAKLARVAKPTRRRQPA